MGPFGVVIADPFISVSLKLFQTLIQFLAKGNLVEFVKDRFVKPLADTVGLW